MVSIDVIDSKSTYESWDVESPFAGCVNRFESMAKNISHFCPVIHLLVPGRHLKHLRQIPRLASYLLLRKILKGTWILRRKGIDVDLYLCIEMVDKCFLSSRSTRGKAASQNPSDDEHDVFLEDFNTRWVCFWRTSIPGGCVFVWLLSFLF
jgi:hypothetical protein